MTWLVHTRVSMRCMRILWLWFLLMLEMSILMMGWSKWQWMLFQIRKCFSKCMPTKQKIFLDISKKRCKKKWKLLRNRKKRLKPKQDQSMMMKSRNKTKLISNGWEIKDSKLCPHTKVECLDWNIIIFRRYTYIF